MCQHPEIYRCFDFCNLQALQARVCKLSNAYLAATVSIMRSLCHEVAQAEGAGAPPFDASVGSFDGRYAEVIGLQQDRHKKPWPQTTKSTRPNRAVTKPKVTILPAIEHRGARWQSCSMLYTTDFNSTSATPMPKHVQSITCEV